MNLNYKNICSLTYWIELILIFVIRYTPRSAGGCSDRAVVAALSINKKSLWE